MSMHCQIITLKTLLEASPLALTVIAQWHHNEWAHLNPSQTFAQRCQTMTSVDSLNNTYIAIEDGRPIGTSAIVKNDMDTHPELSPWLASVYVKDEWRGQGVAKRLINHAMHAALKQGVAILYLYTPHHDAMYKKLGWEILSKECYHDEQITIMTSNLRAGGGIL